MRIKKLSIMIVTATALVGLSPSALAEAPQKSVMSPVEVCGGSLTSSTASQYGWVSTSSTNNDNRVSGWTFVPTAGSYSIWQTQVVESNGQSSCRIIPLQTGIKSGRAYGGSVVNIDTSWYPQLTGSVKIAIVPQDSLPRPGVVGAVAQIR